ncbi:hypothetical protein [Ornithinibacillus halotolerans]|uniref:DUF5590 domain-containing protein n=1 Tax=Ornithinibacillus halotolerans TaxID=1274357 RepID=A0A916RM64_9BACI|nr:hypothetical protein [Ornithinibacillus halotolerans]GGA61493.1 hypothetical protein GCM10008025_01840 [Ornithinibacillus halotolerans]
MRNNEKVLPSWTKWIIVAIILILIASTIFLTILYNDIQDTKTEGYQQVEERVLNNTDLSSVTTIETFQSEAFFWIARGTTEADERLIVFVPEDQESDLIIVNEAEVLLEETIKNGWKENCNNCDLVEINPAIVNNKLLWEIIYYDESDRYVLEYVSMSDGEKYEELRFKKMFD